MQCPFSIAKPESAYNVTLTYVIKNVSGGAMGTVRWNSGLKLGSAWANPANGYNRSITFWYDGANWLEVSRGSGDVPN
jgi:hypothetical protein